MNQCIRKLVYKESVAVFPFQSIMLKNVFAVQEVASYVKQQVDSSNFGDLLVCAGSSSLMMSKALVSMWSPAYKMIDSLADPGNPPDALIFPDLSSAGLHSLKEYIYTGQASTASMEDALIINDGGNYGSHFVDVTVDVAQRQDGGETDEVQANLVVGQAHATTAAATEVKPTKQVSITHSD